MAQQITTVVSTKDVGVFDVSYTADADLGGIIPHGIRGGLGGAGAIPEVVVLGAPPNTPATAAQKRLADIVVAAVDATNVTLDKVNAGGSGNAAGAFHVRIIVARSARQLSASRTALLGAIVGGGLGAGA